MSKSKKSRADDHLTLAEQLRKAIDATGEPVGTIAKAAGIPQPVLHRFVTGERSNIRLDTADKLCRHFGMILTQPRRGE